MKRPATKQEKIRMFFLMVEIKALKECMAELYDQFGSLKDPALVRISQIHERKLNQLNQLVQD
jgi:hypothetical protein